MLDRPTAPRAIRRYRFGRHDRLTIDGATYRVADSKNGNHVLQLLTGDVIQDHCIVRSDEAIGDLLRARRLIVEEGYFSKSLAMLRAAQDNSDVMDIAERDLRTMMWKREWCRRFALAARDLDAPWRPNRTAESLDAFVEAIKDEMDAWYLKNFGERRRPGRSLGERRKPFDYPSASALRGWLKLYRLGGLRGLAPHYAKCGNRNQIDPRAVRFIEKAVRHYSGVNKFAMQDIVNMVEIDLHEWNGRNPSEAPITVSASAVRRRIHRIDPFMKTLGRYGPGKALARFAPVGKGLKILKPLQRVEIDDWEMDLFTLLSRTSTWKALSPKRRKEVPRIRCTATVAIDVATRCIVGFALNASAPSTPGSKTALRRVMVDKEPLTEWANTSSDWPMFGRPEYVATDGGPAFRGDFEKAVMFCRSSRTLPDQDPRMRGTIESFFKTFKAMCRSFAGQSFANVVEKGDYDGQVMAAVTFEEIYKLSILYIVDVYHHRRHRGLEGGTPYAAWKRLAAEHGFAPPLSTVELLRAFGNRGEYTLDKHGITIGRYSYASDELEVLHRLIGEAQVTAIQDPNDLGDILVVIPKHVIGRKGLPAGQFLVASSVDPRARGRAFDEVHDEWTKLRAITRQEEIDGNVHRIGGNRILYEAGHRTRVEADIVEFVVTDKDHREITRAVEHKARAGRGDVGYSTQPVSIDEGIGRAVAKPARISTKSGRPKHGAASRPSPTNPPADGATASANRPKPFGGSINSGGDDV